MRKIALLLALVAGLFTSQAHADWTGKDASLATVTFKNPQVCTSVVCTPIAAIFDPTGTNGAAVDTAGADAVSNTKNGLATYSRMIFYNGTTWDRWQGAVTVAGVATAANQTTGNTSLATIATNSGTQATAASQTTINTSIGTTNTDLGPPGATACATDTGSCAINALMQRVAQNLTTLNTTASASTPAGENHIGEIASNQIKVQVAQTVTASAYSTGNALGALMTVANAARVSGSAGAAGTGGILTGLMLNVKSVQSVQVDVFLFDANPTGSTCTDKTAFVLATADFDKVIGMLTIPGTAANGAGWFSGGTGSVGVPTYYPVTYDLASSTSIYACAVVRGAFTPAATTDVSFKYNILRN